MKRTGNLFERIVERDNLRLAFYKAARGKRYRRGGAQLCRRPGKPGSGTCPATRRRHFRDRTLPSVPDPRSERTHHHGTVLCEERVLHHAVMNVCEPDFERWLIDDTFACRKGKGRIAALLRAQAFARRHAYFLKIDIRKYFDSVPHANLLRTSVLRASRIGRCWHCSRRSLRGFRPGMGIGLPIGSLTSQHFANFYLGWFDRFVKERLPYPRLSFATWMTWRFGPTMLNP